MKNEKTDLKKTKNTLDSSAPHQSAFDKLSEADKKKMELGGMMEHEHGQKREDLEKQIVDKDKP